MQLARMDDIAGCRVIFPDIAALIDFRDKLHRASFNHVRKNDVNKYDYITSPTGALTLAAGQYLRVGK